MPDTNPPFVHILDEAAHIIEGPRRSSYGDVSESFQRIADMWSPILRRQVFPYEVALCMIALKICREINEHGHDNLVDIIGYAALMDSMYGGE